MFLSFDGIDGVGKTTQMDLLCSWLRGQGREVVTCRDPGSTQLGETLRGILLDGQAHIARPAEMLLYMAARAQLVAEVIEPALAAGKTVVSDRFLVSNVVYQGHAGGLDIESLWAIGKVACQGRLPDLTMILDMPPERAVARLRRPLDRMEREGGDSRTLRREGFLKEAARLPNRIVVVNADQPIERVAADLRAAVSRLLPTNPH